MLVRTKKRYPRGEYVRGRKAVRRLARLRTAPGTPRAKLNEKLRLRYNRKLTKAIAKHFRAHHVEILEHIQKQVIQDLQEEVDRRMMEHFFGPLPQGVTTELPAPG